MQYNWHTFVTLRQISMLWMSCFLQLKHYKTYFKLTKFVTVTVKSKPLVFCVCWRKSRFISNVGTQITDPGSASCLDDGERDAEMLNGLYACENSRSLVISGWYAAGSGLDSCQETTANIHVLQQNRMFVENHTHLKRSLATVKRAAEEWHNTDIIMHISCNM